MLNLWSNESLYLNLNSPNNTLLYFINVQWITVLDSFYVKYLLLCGYIKDIRQ